jgi:glycosyltransferase involved in cell wall biosynthesis
MTALTSRIELSALNDVDVVLVYNDILLNHVRALGQQSVIKAPPGVDTDRFTPSPGGWRANGYLLSLCRLNDTRKGLDRMVLAYDQMLRADPEVPDLVLAGKGELPHHMTEMIRGLNLASKVHVRSGVDPSELPRLYQGASVFLLTSHEEGFGMSVLEAMACGLPVVSTETAGTRETVSNGRTGWLVAQDADTVVADEVAKRTLAVLQASGKDLGAQARTRCLSIFSLEVTLHRFIDVYDSLA